MNPNPNWGMLSRGLPVLFKRMSSSLAALNFAAQKESIIESTKAAIAKANVHLDEIGSTASPSFNNAMKKLAWLEGEIQTNTAAASFLQHVSTDVDIRDASVEAQKLLDDFYIEKGMREDVFKVARSIKSDSLDTESARFLEKALLGFKQNGLELSPEKREILRTKRKQLAELCTDYSRNLNEDKTSILCTKEELEGCTEDFLASLSRKDELFIVTTKYPDVAGVMQYAKNEETRRRIDVAFNSRAQENSELLEKAIRLRFECAQLLGYSTHADFVLEDRLAKTKDAVLKFEKDLRTRLIPLGQKEFDLLKQLKKSETESDSFRTWDFQYYSRIIKERDYSVDEEQLKQYFSLDSVMDEMLKLYEEVLGLKFVVDPNEHKWHKDVTAVKVYDGEQLMGLLYLDLYPRDGKYSHAACFQLAPGHVKEDGSVQLPTSAIVANFTKPTETKPSLLKHDEVVTLFHELGHAMHDMCAKVTYSRFHGTNVETDFVEAPSQMLENWCWDKATLKRLSRHYQTGKPLPETLIDNLIKTKNFNAGYFNLRQVFFGLFDMTIHGITDASGLPNGESINSLYARLRKEITMLEQPEDVCPPASFGHMMGGYDAGYYGYLWSEVFSADMFFSKFEANGLQDKQTGLAYRREILQPGASRDGMASIRAFLGRDPTPDAFLRSIGLSA